MELGGAEISLIGLLNSLDPVKVDVDLFIFSHRGPLMEFIPKWVNILPEIPQYAQMENPLKEVFKKGYWRQGIARLKAKLKYRKWALKNNPITHDAYFQYLDNAITPTLPSLFYLGEYDLAINFIAIQGVVLKKIKAKKKIAWIHTDLSTVGVDIEKELPSWSAFDYIASISTDVTSAFLSKFPSLSGKIIEIENILSPDFVKSRANEFTVENEIPFRRGITLLSIGRYSFPKNFENIPFILKELMRLLSIGRFCDSKILDNVPDSSQQIIESGISDIKWFIIGFGAQEELIRQKINEAGMENHIILLGRKENPYPYIKACDIYIQPSRYEGKSVTVREAQMLGKPVIVTNYPTAPSQIRHGFDGLIVPMDNEGCAKGIAEAINNPKLLHLLSENCGKSDFGNVSEVNKIYQFFDNTD